MNFGILLIGCSIIALPRDVETFELVHDAVGALTWHSPNPIDPRHEQILASLKNYVITDTAGLAKQWGYQAEEHTVMTEDGFYIKCFRVQDASTSAPSSGKPVVFIQHGIFASSDSWLLVGKGYDLALILASLGNDVWIGNVRGNRYGRTHANLTTNDKKFWDYSFHEIGTKDLPAMFDYILRLTGQKDLIYFGHSMGTSVITVLLAEKPEYNEKLRLVVCLAPIALWEDRLNLFFRFVDLTAGWIQTISGLFGYYSAFPQWLSAKILCNGFLCRKGSITRPLCIFVVYTLFGLDPIDFNFDLLPYITCYNPAGISIKTMVHYAQNQRTHKFRQFDHGRRGNLKAYGTKEPPAYDFTKVTAPYVLIYGHSDAISKEKSAIALSERLTGLVSLESVSLPEFAHLDFMWGTHVNTLLYSRCSQLVSTYTNDTTENNEV